MSRYDIGMLSRRNSYAHPSPCKSKNSNSLIASCVFCKSVIGLLLLVLDRHIYVLRTPYFSSFSFFVFTLNNLAQAEMKMKDMKLLLCHLLKDSMQ